MVSKTGTPPSGPRSTGQSLRQPSARQPTRGGVQKRGATPLRTDRDGDLEMAPTDTKTRDHRTVRSGRGAAIRGAAVSSQRQDNPGSSKRAGSRPPRSGIDTSAVQKAILKQMGLNERLPKGPRGKIRGHPHKEELERLWIYGLKESKAASNTDGGITDLISFLERKATHANEEALKIKKSRMEGDVLIISVQPADTTRLMKLNNYSFAGATLRIESPSTHGDMLKSETDSQTPNTIEVLKAFLARRYDPQTRFLDLSLMGSDSELVRIGMFNTTSTESKFFPALMKVCDGLFHSAKEKEDAVKSVSLAGNALPNISVVTSLAQTFPNLTNLDLSNNQIASLKALDGWRLRFSKLDHIMLTGNPIESNETALNTTLMKWYSTLTKINTVQVRSPDKVKSIEGNQLPLPILGPSFRDEGAVGENFVKQFFLGFDTGRIGLVNGYYDSNSTFSLNINTAAPRSSATNGEDSSPKWDHYINRSRNLSRVSHLQARTKRLYNGVQATQECFKSIPPTRHPDIVAEPHKWCIECHAIPGLPDSSGQSPSGVGGLMIMVHGEFVELDAQTNQGIATRSFDRTFILGPGNGIGGVRVLSDSITVRAYGGYEAWIPDSVGAASVAPPSAAPAAYDIQVPQGYGIAGQGKTQEGLEKELLIITLSKTTGMTLPYSEICLKESGWDLKGAGIAFEQAKANLPRDAFVS